MGGEESNGPIDPLVDSWSIQMEEAELMDAVQRHRFRQWQATSVFLGMFGWLGVVLVILTLQGLEVWTMLIRYWLPLLRLGRRP